MNDEDSVDQILARDPQNIAALVDKADLRARTGDDRAAAAFYKAALAAAGRAGPLPMRLKPVIERAQAGMARSDALFERYLEDKLSSAGLPPGKRPPRFQHALDVMRGRAHVQMDLQRPKSFYFPGLPQRRYYERSEFEWVPAVEAAAGAMLAELQAFQQSAGDRFAPYMVSDPTRPRGDFHGLLDNPEWSTLYLWEKGGPVPGVADFFPATMAALEQVDLAHITVRAPSILFSRLAAGARIPPHHGVLNTRLICHLPLIVPPGCGFRVGGETREWRPGELLIFDDSVEHEAWNEGSGDRTILIFDIWRPEVQEDERSAIVAMFEAVDGYSQ